MDNSIRSSLLALALAVSATTAHADPKVAATSPTSASASASAEVARVSRWVLDSRDNAGLPFLLVDKVNARVFAFDAGGQLRGEAPVLLGMARGDRMLASNDTAVDAIPPQERITPAGRYLSRLALDSHGKELLVIDYAAAISLHPVVTNKPEERRVERLQTATVQDNRISHGCINVPADFYAKVVSPAFTGKRGVVYILPETQPVSAVFDLRLASAATPGSGALAPGAKSAK